MHRSIQERVRTEVEDLHTFFVGWFTGQLPASAFETGFRRRFDPSFLLVPPAGSLLTLEQLSAGIRDRRGSNPDFRIAIRNVEVRRTLEGLVLATYEEWQRNALASTPPDNGRIATVLFETTELRWLHVHETWLPDAAVSAGSFDF